MPQGFKAYLLRKGWRLCLQARNVSFLGKQPPLLKRQAVVSRAPGRAHSSARGHSASKGACPEQCPTGNSAGLWECSRRGKKQRPARTGLRVWWARETTNKRPATLIKKETNRGRVERIAGAPPRGGARRGPSRTAGQRAFRCWGYCEDATTARAVRLKRLKQGRASQDGPGEGQAGAGGPGRRWMLHWGFLEANVGSYLCT